ncbi:unnamed protein product, partial [Nesidiocoris tenuis]
MCHQGSRSISRSSTVHPVQKETRKIQAPMNQGESPGRSQLTMKNLAHQKSLSPISNNHHTTM